MSLINQVLNRLERRGIHIEPGQTLVRAVPPRRARYWGRMGLLAGVMLAILGGLLWLVGGDHRQSVEEETSGQITSQPAAQSAVQQAAQSATPVKTEPPLKQQPASRLSFELSLPPLPDTLRRADEITAEIIPLAPEPPAREVPPKKSSLPSPPRPRANDKAKPGERPSARKQLAAQSQQPQPLASAEAEHSPALKLMSPQQRADAEYRAGLLAQQAGRVPEALAAFEAALKMDERHQPARLALATLLFNNGQASAAEQVLQTGLMLKPVPLEFAMALARMQVERGQLPQAMETLQRYLAQADNSADYQAFYAALLQREQRHMEAVNHYERALRLQPRNGTWLMGYGISLRALERKEDAIRAYQQALATQTLSPELSTFVQQELVALGQAKQGR